jgi:hypothetical protein
VSVRSDGECTRKMMEQVEEAQTAEEAKDGDMR